MALRRGYRPAAEEALHGLRSSVVYRWQRIRRLAWVHEVTSGGTGPDNDRYDPAAFLPVDADGYSGVRSGSVDVVIPVYEGFESVRQCIASVLSASSPAVASVIVVDDCSADDRVVDYLDDLHDRGSIQLLRNAANLGFVASVNRGIVAAGGRDVILLNSDTLVAGDWADRLAAHAYGARVGTVTPFSNNATICSYPHPGVTNVLIPGETVAGVDASFAAANRGRACDLPTAVGFCMFISRACLDTVGSLDEQAFGRGYGEENDFCLRAAEQGWRNVLAADVFVWHQGEVSFGPEAARLQEAALDELQTRYPGYLASVARHAEADPGRPWRVAATAARFRADERPVVLFVLHAFGTGTERHALDVCRRYADEVRFLVLRATFDGFVRLMAPDPMEDVDVLWRVPNDLEGLVALVRSFGVDRVHVHHVLGFPFDVSEFIDSLGVPFDFTVHDYFALCPRVRLTTPPARYCGGPMRERCAACLALPPSAGVLDIGSWQRRYGWLLSEADRVICPSRDAAARVQASVSGGSLVVAPHDGLDHQTFPAPRPVRPRPGEPLRIALIGVLSDDKGARTVAACLRLMERLDHDAELLLVGYVEPESRGLLRGTGLRATGPYETHDVPALLEQAAPHVVWFPASWPETYSYTLSEAMTAGLPVIAPDIGAFPERLAERPWSWLLPWSATSEQYLECFVEVRACLDRAEPMSCTAGYSSAFRSLAGPVGPPDLAFYDGAYLQPLGAASAPGDDQATR